MKIIPKRLALLLCALSPTVLATGCPDAVYCRNGVCTGYYYDSLVSGLAYESRSDGVVTHTGVTGENDDPGRFSHAEGGVVSFSLGAVSLGETVAKERVTPFDLAGIAEEPVGGCDVSALPDGTSAFRRVANLAVLLQTLDTDGDDTNGIEIRPEVAALFEGLTLGVDQASASFEADGALLGLLDQANTQGLFSSDRALVQRADALRALYQGIGLCP
jgi:para-nitrobenzyl esterase